MINYFKPIKIIEHTLNSCEVKANKSFYKLLILGFLSGVFVSVGCIINVISIAAFTSVNPWIGKLIGAGLFPVGLIMILILGTELFTSNTLMTIAVVDKRVTIKKALRNLTIVYFANMLGTIFMGYVTLKIHTLEPGAVILLQGIAEYKVQATISKLLIGGMLCNVLVCGGVMVSYSSTDIAGKIIAVWFPITVFVILGYDHCVANMLYLFTGLMSGASITMSGIAYNLFFSTIGNFVGGGLFMGTLLYTTVYHK